MSVRKRPALGAEQLRPSEQGDAHSLWRAQRFTEAEQGRPRERLRRAAREPGPSQFDSPARALSGHFFTPGLVSLLPALWR
jgi:hypothetical protein